MLFNSLAFLIFLPVVFVLYWAVFNRTVAWRNAFILGISYYFYGSWDWRFLFLIAFVSGVCYLAGIKIEENERNKPWRQVWLTSACVICFGLVGVFKYFNFFIENFVAMSRALGCAQNVASLHIILPVGISFFTFQAMSYVIDVYRGQMRASRDWVAFFSYISYFPQLVAGPIERSTNLLPQFGVLQRFNYDEAADGLRQALWGFFKKIVIADNCAIIVNQVYANYESMSSRSLLFAAVLFAFQIYGDFSGYSDIAIGCSRLFGFRLMRNFANPYFSRDVAEFWRRWHISLSTWFRDYLYFPLGGSRCSRWKTVRNVFLMFGVSGFWHGANWTFIVWGLLNACYFLPGLLTGNNRRHTNCVAEGRLLPTVKEVFLMAGTFAATVFAWVFFRAESLSKAVDYLARMLTLSEKGTTKLVGSLYCSPTILLLLLLFFISVEWVQREKQHALWFNCMVMPAPIRWVAYYVVIAIIFAFGAAQQTFIYFQF